MYTVAGVSVTVYVSPLYQPLVYTVTDTGHILRKRRAG